MHLNTQWPELRQRFLNGKIAEMVFFEVVTGHCVFPATQLTRLHNGVNIVLYSHFNLHSNILSRAATSGKTAQIAVLRGFFKIEHGG